MSPNFPAADRQATRALTTPAAAAQARTDDHREVLRFGGGPGGAAMAALLARQGRHVVLLERPHHPQLQIGEALLPANVPLLDTLGVRQAVEQIGMPVAMLPRTWRSLRLRARHIRDVGMVGGERQGAPTMTGTVGSRLLPRAARGHNAVAAVLLLAAAAAAPSARADQPLWELGAGVGGLRLPHYRGAAESSAWVVPIPYAVYRGKILRADRSGTRAVLFDSERVDVDLSVSASAPARSDDNAARRGMPDLKGQIEFGPKLNLRLAGDGDNRSGSGSGPDWRLDLRLPLRAVATLERHPHAVGYSFAPVLNLDTRVQGFNVGLQTGPLWGDRRLHRTTYEVAPAYATPERPAYQARGGFAGWQATAAVSRRVGRWWGAAYVRGDSVAGAAFDDSPLVKRHNNVSAGFALSYVFATSSATVPGNLD